MCYSGSIVTGGGLIFVGRNDGRLTALDKADGALLWDFQTDAGLNATASTFEHGGQQYVVALAAGTFFPGTERGDSVWLFALNGGRGVDEAAACSAAGDAALDH
jgi:glucose dehydrogenase